MQLDPVSALGPSRRRLFTVLTVLLFVCVWVFSGMMFYWQFSNTFSDLYVHAMIAADFDFGDLHSITSRLSYPMWHLIVAVLLRTSMEVGFAAALVTGLMKALIFLLCDVLLYTAMETDTRRRWLPSVLALLMAVVTPVRVAAINPTVYGGVGSMTVWHNPTQQTVNVSMLLLIPWLCHCRAEFDRMKAEGVQSIRLPWWKVIVLALLAFGSISCKPTLMQCLLPAAFVWFLCLMIRDPKHPVFYTQMVLAFLPAAGYFLLSYLYYTGVVVEYTSGAEFELSLSALLVKLRATLLMGLCPFLTLIAVSGKRLRRDHLVTVSLLMLLFAIPEAAWFYETGLRSGHGNFTWALNSAMLMLWISALRAALREVPLLKAEGEWNPIRRVCLYTAGAAGLWHAVSGVYYLCYLLRSGNSF